jgi:hypothetical protein
LTQFGAEKPKAPRGHLPAAGGGAACREGLFARRAHRLAKAARKCHVLAVRISGIATIA